MAIQTASGTVAEAPLCGGMYDCVYVFDSPLQGLLVVCLLVLG